jgi:hypothetical protein
MNEIEEFLKRAAAMRARQQGVAPATPAAPPVQAPVAPPLASPLNPLARSVPLPTRLSNLEVQDAEVIEAEEVSGDDVADYVTRHLDSSKFSQRASRLGSDIKSSDEGIEAHLHQTFVHRLGQLGAATTQTEESILDEDENAARAAASAISPVSIATMLRSPQSLRNAIILSEVLNPPHHRW